MVQDFFRTVMDVNSIAISLRQCHVCQLTIMPAKRKAVDELHEVEQGSAPKARKLARRDTDQQVQRLVDEHWPTLSPSEVHNVKRDGKSLFATLTQLKHGKKLTNGRLGATMLATLKKKFSPAAGMKKKLEVKKGSLVAEPVEIALEHFLTKNPLKRSNAPLLALFSESRRLTEAELNLVLTSVVDLSPVNPSSRTLLLQIMHALVSNGYTKSHDKSVQACVPLWDATLARAYASSRSDRQKMEHWVMEKQSLIEILPAGPAILEVTRSQGSMQTVQQSMRTAAEASMLGKLMFANASHRLKHTDFSKGLEEKLHKLVVNGKITKEKLKEIKDISVDIGDL